MMHIRDKVLITLKKKSDDATKALYKKFRNRVAVLLKESKTNYFHNFFYTNGNNIKLLWSGLNSIISNNNSKTNIISKLNDVNGNVTTDPKEIANTFNNFFCKCCWKYYQGYTKDKKVSYGLSRH